MYWMRTEITTRLIQVIHHVAPVERPWAARLVEALHTWAENEIAHMNIARNDHDQV